MTIAAPKCRTCGVQEWRHTCLGAKRTSKAAKRDLVRKALVAQPKSKKAKA